MSLTAAQNKATVHILGRLEQFTVDDAHCYDPNEEFRLRKVIDAVGKDRFRDNVRKLAKSVAADLKRRSDRSNKRSMVFGSRNRTGTHASPQRLHHSPSKGSTSDPPPSSNALKLRAMQSAPAVPRTSDTTTTEGGPKKSSLTFPTAQGGAGGTVTKPLHDSDTNLNGSHNNDKATDGVVTEQGGVFPPRTTTFAPLNFSS